MFKIESQQVLLTLNEEFSETLDNDFYFTFMIQDVYFMNKEVKVVHFAWNF